LGSHHPQSARGYIGKVAEGKLGEPQWPDMDFLEAIQKGFKKTGIVDKADHPLIKRLHGLSI
jgi:hypothetical protein